MGSGKSYLLPVVATVLVAATAACATRANYLGLEGPRYAADYALRAEAVVLTVPLSAAPRETFKVVSYNVRYGQEVDAAIEVLARTPELADADIILLQEMHTDGVDRVARALGCSYVYYPASLRTSGRDFGNAVLTRGRILEDRKVLLPHLNPFNRQQRIAVRTDLELGRHALAAYSVHTETPFLSIHDRAEQIDALLTSVPECSTPCLIAGDFNTLSPRSLLSFESRFADQGFQRASAGLGSTFRYGPFRYALDHVFVRGLEVVDAGKVEDANASDHIPIWVELAWTRQPAAPTPPVIRAGI
jgi:endonuclease/exonuclease/phosphatase family metal-dependent hydrolase